MNEKYLRNVDTSQLDEQQKGLLEICLQAYHAVILLNEHQYKFKGRQRFSLLKRKGLSFLSSLIRILIRHNFRISLNTEQLLAQLPEIDCKGQIDVPEEPPATLPKRSVPNKVFAVEGQNSKCFTPEDKKQYSNILNSTELNDMSGPEVITEISRLLDDSFSMDQKRKILNDSFTEEQLESIVKLLKGSQQSSLWIPILLLRLGAQHFHLSHPVDLRRSC